MKHKLNWVGRNQTFFRFEENLFNMKNNCPQNQRTFEFFYSPQPELEIVLLTLITNSRKTAAKLMTISLLFHGTQSTTKPAYIISQ